MERLIEGTTTLRASAERAMHVVCTHDDVVLGTRTLAASRHRELGLGPLHHEIALELDGSITELGRVVRPMRWEAAMHPELFPVFGGELVLERDDEGLAVLYLRGTYVVPLGSVGSFGDGVAGRRIARRCIAGFLEDIARRIDHAAEPLIEPDEGWHYDVRVTDAMTASRRTSVPAG